MHPKSFKVIGIMSGTSLDGVDFAYCEFDEKEVWNYKIHYATTFQYDNKWKQKLSEAANLNAIDFLKLHKEYGKFLGQLAKIFIEQHKIYHIDLISSHGHTIFHQPEQNFNFQIGDGAFIASETGITTISDFRTLDIALNGQGAPLVPIGDELLFNKYNYCLNIGGFANISYKDDDKRIAFDICPSNFVLNYLAEKLNSPYDKDGEISRNGNVNHQLLEHLNKIDYYQLQPPKSLGREWVEQKFFPIIESYNCSFEDKLATCVEHIAIQIAQCTNKKGEMLITGGGAYNKHLIEKITLYSKCKVVVPDKNLIEFKEALIFAFLGLLRWQRRINVLKSVTGAKQDSISGCVYIVK